MKGKNPFLKNAQFQIIIVFQEYPRRHLWQMFHPEGAGLSI